MGTTRLQAFQGPLLIELVDDSYLCLGDCVCVPVRHSHRPVSQSAHDILYWHTLISQQGTVAVS